jgi:hypothetical protein
MGLTGSGTQRPYMGGSRSKFREHDITGTRNLLEGIELYNKGESRYNFHILTLDSDS